MTITKISRILNAHHISHKLVDNHIFAEEVYTYEGQVNSNWIDVTNFTFGQLLGWLGY